MSHKNYKMKIVIALAVFFYVALAYDDNKFKLDFCEKLKGTSYYKRYRLAERCVQLVRRIKDELCLDVSKNTFNTMNVICA